MCIYIATIELTVVVISIRDRFPRRVVIVHPTNRGVEDPKSQIMGVLSHDRKEVHDHFTCMLKRVD